MAAPVDISDLKFAFNETRTAFAGLWGEPINDELHIFYQFLIKQTFSQLQISSSDLLKFWNELNTSLANELGEDEYYKFSEKRSSRFRNYSLYYSELSKSGFFQHGGRPNSQSEFNVMIDFASAVFNFVERDEVSVKGNAEKFLEFVYKCFDVIGIHILIINGGKDNYIYLHKN